MKIRPLGNEKTIIIDFIPYLRYCLKSITKEKGSFWLFIDTFWKEGSIILAMY